MRVIGTAGHVDHGKSALVAALTGTHPDRLKEEREREMTIDLGFGWLTLPDGEEVGIIDVPGHRDFIENMLAGIGGIDAAILVIAADEGVMPQTREHLAILDLLQIPSGLIALTKTDLVQDPAWLGLVTRDIQLALANTSLRDAPIIPVSAKTGDGLNPLISNLQFLLQNKSPRPNLSRPRLPVDRVFSMAGFGTVVTGTLNDGTLSVGDEIEILPSGLRGRVRGLQTHKKKEEHAVPGSRTAVNISGVNAEQIRRGEVLAKPNQYQPTRRLDARFRLLADASAALQHNDEVKFFIGASETIGIVRLLGVEQLAPSEDAWIQLELREPIVAVRGDRYILRRPSPSETLGGGSIVDPHPSGRHKRMDESVLASLELMAGGSPSEMLMQAALALGVGTKRELAERARVNESIAEAAIETLIADGSLIALGESLVITLSQWEDLRDKAIEQVAAHHKNFPLRRGMPREELKSKLKLDARLFNLLITNYELHNLLIHSAGFLALPSHKVIFSVAQQIKVDALLNRFASAPFATPSVKECVAEAGEDVFVALADTGAVRLVSPEVVFRTADYESLVAGIKSALLERGQISLAEVRDLFGTSRKYAQALLEHLDSIGVTVRDGDVRRGK